jgi:hypothetical protein
MAFNYSYNKQVVPSDLFNSVVDGLSITPMYIDYNAQTFNIDIWFEQALTAPEESILNDIVANIIFVDKSNYATFENVTSTEGDITSLTANTIESSFSNIGDLSASTIYSGSTNLYDIFLTSSDGNDITRVQPGTNITTGGTANNPTINLVDSPSVNNIAFSGTATGGNIFATQLSGGTIYSGSTNLYSIFAPIGSSEGVQNVLPGSNITTGGTATSPTINLSESPSVNNLTFSGTATGGNAFATQLSGGTIYSGSTNLYDIFVDSVKSGSNVTIGGTSSNPIVNITASPSFNNLTLSGTATGGNVFATQLSGGTIYSGSTDLYNIFLGLNDDYVKNVVNVGKGGNVEFSSIKDAVDSITAATTSNPYVVKVGPGMYIEDTITMKTGISIVANSLGSVLVIPTVNTNTIFVGADASSIVNLVLTNASGSGGKAVYHNGTGGTGFLIKDCNFNDNETQVHCYATSASSIVYIDRCSVTGNNAYGFKIENTGTTLSQVIFTNGTYKDTTLPVTTDFFTVSGTGSTCTITNSTFRIAQSTGSTFLKAQDSADVRIIGSVIRGFENGLYSLSGNGAPNIICDSLGISECTNDILIEHPGTTGYFNGISEFSKISINNDAPFYLTNNDTKIIKVAKKGEDFTSIADAVNFITDASSTNRYLISVGAGIFYEDEIDLTNKPFISVVGASIQSTLVIPNTGTQHLFKMGNNCEISFMSLSGVGNGYSAVYVYDIGDFAQAHKISIIDCDTNVHVESVTQDTIFYGEYMDFNGNYSYGAKAVANNNYQAFINLENYYIFPSGDGVQVGNFATGSGATFNILSSSMAGMGNTGETAIHIEDGASLDCTSVDIDSFYYGIRNANVGSDCSFDLDAISITNSGLYDISIENSTTTGTILGSASHTQIFNASNSVSWLILDSTDGELDITNQLSVTFTDGTHTDLSTILIKGATMGIIEGGVITEVSGLTINISTGFGYLEKAPNTKILKRIDWDSQDLVLPSNSNLYIYFNENGVLSTSGSRPNSINNIILGRVVTNSSIEIIDLSPLNAEHTSNRYSDLFTEAIGPIYADGSIVTENTTPFHLDASSGKYYYSTNEFKPTGGTDITFVQYNRTGLTGWTSSATTVVTNSLYDNNGSLSALSSSYYTKHTFYLIGDSIYEQYLLVLGQNQYATLLETEDALLPTPPTYFSDSLVQIANIYVQEGATGITQVEDIRPIIGFKAGGVNASSTHGNLLGLSADDHTQYLLVDGGRAMSGNLDMDSNNIVNAGTINGVSAQTHSTRHLPNGADPLNTAAPISISDSNSEGIANSFARSDHQHAHGVHSGGTTHSVADSTTAGFMSSTDKNYLDSLPSQLNTKSSLSGATFTGAVNATSLSATTLSGGTILSGSTNLYSIFAPIGTIGSGGVQSVRPGSNITTGGTAESPIINIVDSPSFNGLNASGNTILNATTAITQYVESYLNIGNANPETTATLHVTSLSAQNQTTDFEQFGFGSNFRIRRTNGSPSSKSTLLSGDVIGNLNFAGYDGVSNSASQSRIRVLTTEDWSPTNRGTKMEFSVTPIGSIDNTTCLILNSDCSAVFSDGLSAKTISATTIFSGSTNLYSIFAPIGTIGGGGVKSVRPGSNITTGGTAENPIINLVDSPSVNNLNISGLTTSTDGATFVSLSGTNIFSGSTNLNVYFDSINARLETEANLSGATFTGTVNAPTLSATTFSASSATVLSSLRFPVSPVSGYILTSDANGNAAWQASPVGTGATKVDLQGVSTGSTATATSAFVDVPGMTFTTKNLGSSATTYVARFNAQISNNNNAGSSTFAILRNNVVQPSSVRTVSNSGAAMTNSNRSISTSATITGVTNGDVIKVQFSAATGTVTVTNRGFDIFGILNVNLV